MQRQTVQQTEWIVADGGQTPAVCTMGQTHIHQPSSPGVENFAHNLLSGIARAKGAIVVVIEDDDYLRPFHIESMVAALDQPHALIAGRHEQIYYHVGVRYWRMMRSPAHSSLCQTAFKRGAVHAFESSIRDCLASGKFYIDVEFWKRIATAQWAIAAGQTCIGIKGMYPGLGIGHRPTGSAWKADPDMAQLRAWVGEDADAYAEFSTNAFARA